jgi:ribosomal protein RSM22 (predicted rRNA methylase)
LIAKVPRRAKQDYARARRWRWGDAVMELPNTSTNTSSS